MTFRYVLAVLSAAGVVVGFVSTVVSLYNSIHIRKTNREVKRVAVRVNGNIAALVSRIDQLTKVMHDHGVSVPPPPPPPVIVIPPEGEQK